MAAESVEVAVLLHESAECEAADESVGDLTAAASQSSTATDSKGLQSKPVASIESVEVAVLLDESAECEAADDTVDDLTAAASQSSTTTDSKGLQSKPVASVDNIFGVPVDPVVEAQTYDAMRWIPLVGDAYSLGRAAYFALGGNMEEAGLCALAAVPFAGNALVTAKRVKEAKDAKEANENGEDNTSAATLPPIYEKLLNFFDEMLETNDSVGSGSQAAIRSAPRASDEQEEKRVAKGSHSASDIEKQRRQSVNNFGESDPVLLKTIQAHEAALDCGAVDVTTSILSEQTVVVSATCADR